MPSINGGMKFVKYLLFLFNLLFVILGVVLIWIGFSVKNEFNRYFPTLSTGDDGGHSIPPTIFIAVGFIMFFIAFLGCCGAVTENHCMMMLYSVLVGLILVIQLGGAIAAYAFQDDVEKALSVGMNDSLNEYYNHSSPAQNDTIQSWKFIQMNLECCGVGNYTDWAHADERPTIGFIPTSCCKGGSHDKCTDSITLENYMDDMKLVDDTIYVDGCLPKAIDVVSITHIGTTGIIVAVIQLLGIICACMMARSIRYSYETV